MFRDDVGWFIGVWVYRDDARLFIRVCVFRYGARLLVGVWVYSDDDRLLIGVWVFRDDDPLFKRTLVPLIYYHSAIRVTRQGPLVQQELQSLPEHLGSTPYFSRFHSCFSISPFFFWPLSFSGLRHLITSCGIFKFCFIGFKSSLHNVYFYYVRLMKKNNEVNKNKCNLYVILTRITVVKNVIAIYCINDN